MADYIFNKLTTVVSGINTAISFRPQSTSPFTLQPGNGTISVVNFSNITIGINKNTTPALPPKRPQTGQVFPRGVYNK